MSGTGQTEVLAQGVSNVLGSYYVIIAPFIGLLGSFITGSNMSSNILFANFQMTTSQIVGLNTHAILGAQTAGAGIGTSIAPGNIVLGTTTAGILGSEGQVLKKIIPFALGVASLYGFLLYGLMLIYFYFSRLNSISSTIFLVPLSPPDDTYHTCASRYVILLFLYASVPVRHHPCPSWMLMSS